MAFGFDQFLVPSPVGHFAYGFFWEELCPLPKNFLGFPFHHPCLSLQRGHAHNHNLES
jgi:hypothetical protein